MAEEIPKDTYGEMKNLDRYFLEYQKYKEGSYQFGNYSTKEQIHEEFLKGKIFVLKGGLRVVDWISMILLLTIVIVSILILFYYHDPSSVLFIPFPIFLLPVGSIMLLTPRIFLVIGPLGVYYRKILSSGAFSWNEVIDIKHFTQRYKRINLGVAVKIYFSDGRKIKFLSGAYLNKEFRRKVKKEMFLNLFYIYSQRETYISFNNRVF